MWRSKLVRCLIQVLGVFTTCITSPLVADVSSAVDDMEAARPGIFGEKGAYARVYSLYTGSMCLAILIGPILGGGLYDTIGLGNMTLVLAIVIVVAVIPVVGTSAPVWNAACLLKVVTDLVFRRQT